MRQTTKIAKRRASRVPTLAIASRMLTTAFVPGALVAADADAPAAARVVSSVLAAIPLRGSRPARHRNRGGHGGLGGPEPSRSTATHPIAVARETR